MQNRLEIPKMYKLFIGGKFTRTESERYLEVYNRSGDKICNVSRASRKDIRNAVSAARSAQSGWSSMSSYERAQILYRLAEMLEHRKEQFIKYISNFISNSKAENEVNASIDRIIYYAGFADKYMQLSGTVNPVQHNYFNFSMPEPAGVTASILPDTLTLLPLVSRIAPIILSGNSCIMLVNEKNPLPSLSFAEVIETSDVPAGVINIVSGLKNELIQHIAGHFDVNSIDYCGNNTDEIKIIQELAANNVKRVSITSNKDWYDNDYYESLNEIEKFTEIKTVWHTVGM